MSDLTTIFSATADAIRAKKGSTEGIYPSDFATEIANIETGSTTSGTSKFHLNKCVLTLDDGYQIERIPITAGEVINLGAGEDVEASTGWGDELYHHKSHPAMTFQSWASSIAITDNQFVVPDNICTDYHVGAIYVTTDGLNHYVEYTRGDGLTHRSDNSSSVVEGSSTAANANQTLTAMWLGNSVTTIAANAFYYCYSLTSINIPDGVTSVGNYTFYNCYSLTSINIPDSVTSIGSYTFRYCQGLTSINIPDGVTSIGTAFVSYCYSLTSINIPDSVTSIGNNAIQGCYSLTSINIPDGVTSVGNYTFYNCYSLTSINIPDSVTSFAYQSFYNCYALSVMILYPPTPPALDGITVFTNCNTTFLVPEDSIEDYKAATNWSTFADYIIADTTENRAKFGLE